MSRRIAFALVLVACSRSTSPSPGAPTTAVPAPTSSAPATVHTGTSVPLARGGSGYFAHPSDGAKHAAIIVVQEWWGLNDWIKDNTDGFAAKGYAALAAIHAALLGNFAGQDRGIAPADVRAFAAQLKTTNPDVDVKIYDPDGHAFMNPGNAKGFDEGAAKDAWARIDAFFARTLAAK